MAILIQKDTGTLSSLISNNGFYQNCFANNTFPNNGGGNNTGYVSLSTSDRNIHFTPTKAGNFKGVILSLYNTNYGGKTARYRDIRIRLQENTGSWTTRLEQTFSTNDWIRDNTWAYFKGLIDCRFNSSYAINTNSNTWRLVLDYVSGGSGTFYFNFAQDGSSTDNLFFIPYIDSVTTLTSSDTLVVTDKIILDQNLSLDREDTDHGANDDMDYRSRYYSIWSCSPIVKSGVETNPQIYVPSTVAGNYKIDLKGSWHLSSMQPKALLVGEDAENPIPYNWSDRSDSSNRTFEIEFSNQVSGQSEYGFITGSIVGYRYGKLAGIELWGTKPSQMWGVLKANALKSQATAIIEGDLTSSWAAGDHIMCGGSKYTSTRFYRDYCFNEIKEIQTISYNSGNDETTVTFTTNLLYNHYYYNDIPVYFTLKERNIIVGGNDTTYNAESYWSIQNGVIKMQGVLLHDIQYIYARYSYTKYMSTQDQTDSKWIIDGCNVHDCFRPLYIYYWQTVLNIINNTSSSDFTGTTQRCDRFVTAVYSKNATINNNVMVGRYIYAVLLSGASNYSINNNYFNIQYPVYLSSGATTNEIKNNVFNSCRTGIYFGGCNNNYFENNKFRHIQYDSNYSAASETTQGCYCFVALYNNTGNVSINDNADRSFAFIVCQNDAMGTHVFKNSKLGDTWKDSIVNESGATFRSSWSPGAEIKFEDYKEETGQCKAWYTNGYIESCGTNLDDTTSHTSGIGKKAWRLNSYFPGIEHHLSFSIPIGVANEPITISIFCKINSLNYAAGTYKKPKLSIEGLGVTGVSIECEADVTNTDWQLLVVSGSPTDTGQLNVKLSIETDAVTTNLDSLNTDGSVYFDDLYAAYKTPLDLGGLDLVYNGLPIFPPLTVVMTASAVWAEQLTSNNQPGSMGLQIGLIDDIPTNPLLTNDSRLDHVDSDISDIPTNPLLTTDTRLDHIDSDISDIPTNPLLTTDTRLDHIDSDISDIPTNPLLTTDTRLDHIDSDISDIPTTSEIVTAIETNIIEGTLSNIEMKRIMFAALSGICSGGGTTNIKFRDLLDLKDRINATIDINTGNRTNIILDGS